MPKRDRTWNEESIVAVIENADLASRRPTLWSDES
jgi:hypothetical protein